MRKKSINIIIGMKMIIILIGLELIKLKYEYLGLLVLIINMSRNHYNNLSNLSIL